MSLRIPPVIVVAAAAFLIWLLSRYVPAVPVATEARLAAAAVLVVAGISVALLGVAAFRRARTTVDPRHPERTATLVSTGIYRFTRNPMYVGFTVVLLAWVVFLASWPGVALVAMFVVYIDRFQIQPEEQALEARFGREFEEYRRSVRRWV